MHRSPPVILTVGHSTHEGERFLRLLGGARVEALADVRRHPGSRRLPQFGRDALERSLAGGGIEYLWLGEGLGGRRRAKPGTGNDGWRVGGFRGYADHMESEQFGAALARLEELAARKRTAFMCAEGDWRRCHRRLISDALLVRGCEVVHLLRDGGREHHRLPPFAAVDGDRIGYPAAQGSLDSPPPSAS